ncbi:cation diffusion facilitator family transporter (plasmid) [Natrinema thermotolerans]|uniref:Cation diffusion facilitator family transporter n=1 Tax=Natrinema thermotolerans TaxID=121872 RepID=A0AAF0PHD1_9EURY|nr:cation diffusion facilitator family transporter [Natrinema thermotolerans]QCC57321.1 cation transporter [Natrinema thermotolerans]WMT10334.1 cation diffusion facilitator family transporter [Natrinema thermotolerans]
MNEHESAHGGSHDDHNHGHGGSSTSSRKLAAVSVINLLGFLAELAGGLLFGSVALLSDAFHMLFDALAYVMAFAAAHIADNYGDSDRWSYGLHRLEPLAAFLNGLLLLPMVGFILWESYQRFLEPVAIGTGPTLAIATGGLLVNIGSVYVLQGGEMSLNERGAFYHLLGDAGGSVAVIISTVVIEVTGLQIIDPIVAGLIAVVITWSAGKVLRGSSAIFLHRTPFEQNEVQAILRKVDGVTAVDDMHAWQICSQITVATVHLETDVETMAEAETVTRSVHAELAHHGVDHATVELCPGYDDRNTHLNNHAH